MRSRVVNGVLLGVAAFVVVVSGLWYLIVVRAPDQVRAESVDHAWGAVSGNESEIVTTVAFHNPHRIDARLLGLRWEWRANDVLLGGGEGAERRTVPPGEDLTLELATAFPTAALGDVWARHAANGEQSRAAFAGEALFAVGREEITVEFADESTWSTGLADSLAEEVRTCSERSAEPCIVRGSFAWREVGGGVVLDGELTVRNPGPDPLTVTGHRAQLSFAAVSVGLVEAASSLRLDPGEEGVVELHLGFDGRAVRPWWPRHVEECERSEAALRLNLRYERLVPVEEPEEEEEEPPANETGNETGDGTGNETGNETGNGTGNSTPSAPQGGNGTGGGNSTPGDPGANSSAGGPGNGTDGNATNGTTAAWRGLAEPLRLVRDVRGLLPEPRLAVKEERVAAERAWLFRAEDVRTGLVCGGG